MTDHLTPPTSRHAATLEDRKRQFALTEAFREAVETRRAANAAQAKAQAAEDAYYALLMAEVP